MRWGEAGQWRVDELEQELAVHVQGGRAKRDANTYKASHVRGGGAKNLNRRLNGREHLGTVKKERQLRSMTDAGQVGCLQHNDGATLVGSRRRMHPVQPWLVYVFERRRRRTREDTRCQSSPH